MSHFLKSYWFPGLVHILYTSDSLQDVTVLMFPDNISPCNKNNLKNVCEHPLVNTSNQFTQISYRNSISVFLHALTNSWILRVLSGPNYISSLLIRCTSKNVCESYSEIHFSKPQASSGKNSDEHLGSGAAKSDVSPDAGITTCRRSTPAVALTSVVTQLEEAPVTRLAQK
jgi:hypothetical protein